MPTMKDEVIDSWYSWVVVAVCFVVYITENAMVQVSGLFYSDILTYFKVDRQWASTPFLMATLARAVSGPLSGFLCRAYGYRFSIILGCTLSSLGIFACFFARDIVVLSIFWSLYGFGYGMSVAPLPRVVNLFNKKHASKATGIALCGPAIAGIILPLFTVTLLNSYGLPGALLIYSAIMLNAIPGAILLREPNSTKLKSKECPRRNVKVIHINEDMKPNGNFTNRSLNETTHEKHEYTNDYLECGYETTKGIQCDKKESEKVESKTLENASSLKNYDEPELQYSFKELRIQTNDNTKKSHSIRHKNIKRNCLNLLAIFWDPLFMSFSFLRCFYGMIFIVLPAILVDLSIDKGVTKTQAPYVLIVYAAADLGGKICLSWITDSNFISRDKYAAICYFVVAVSFVLMVWSNGFVLMIVAVVLESVGNSTTLQTVFVMACQYFDSEKQTLIIPFLDVLLLPMSFCATHLIGYYRDDLGSYDGLSYILSAATFACALLVLSVPTISRWKKQEKKGTT